MAQGRSLGGWDTAGCTQRHCQHRTQVRRVHGRAGGASRRRPTSIQCAATNRLVYQATSQLDPGQDLDHLELEVLQPAGSHEHNIVLRPPAHSLHPPTGQHLRLQQQEPQQSHSPPPQQQQQQGIDAVTQAFVERLYASPDISTVTALLQQVPRQGMQQCYIIRAALVCILRLYAGSGRTARNQAAAHSCLAQLCACAPPAGQGTASSPEQAGQFTPVASWPARNLVLLAKAMASTSWHQCDVWQAVVKATRHQAPELHPWQASQLLWAASRLQAPHQPAADPAWLDALIDRVCAGAGILYPDALAQALHAAARLGHLPQRACMEHLLLHGVQQRLPEWTGGQIACTLWALARFRYHPGSAWLSDVLARAEACTRSFHSGASIASTLWALAVLGHAPPKPWMEHFLWQAQRQLRACDAQAIANIVWALAKLRYRPPNSWAAEMLRMAAQHMHALPLHITRQRALGSTLQQQQAAERPLQESGTAQEHTYASLQHTGTATSSGLVNGNGNGNSGHSNAPSSPARDPLLRASGGSACNGGTAAAQVILWPPSSQPPSHLASAPGQGSSGAPAQGFGAPAAACSAPQQQQQQQEPQQVQGPPQVPAGEQYGEPRHTQPPHGVRDQTRLQTPSPPPPPWGCPMQLQRPAHRPASGAHIPQSPEPESLQTDAHSPQAGAGQAAATTPPQPASAAAGLGVGPSPSELVLELFNEPVAWKGGGASPRTFTMFLWSVAQLQVLPRWPYLRRMCIAMSPALPDFTPRELASCLWSLHKLRHVPDPTMYTQLLAAVRARLPTFDTHSLVVALSAIANFQPTHPVQPPMLHALCQQLALHASQLGPLQTTSVWTSLAHLCSSKECLPASLHESLLSQLHAQLPQMSIRGMVNSVWAATQLARITGNDAHLTSGHAVLPRVMRHVRSHLSSCSHRDLIQLAVALSQANYMVPAEWLSAHESAIRRLVVQGVVSHLELQPLMEAYKHLGADVGPLLQLQAAVAAKARQAAAAAAAAAAAGWQMGATSTCAVAPAAAAAAGLPLVSSLQAPQLTPEQQAVQRQLLRVDERDWRGVPAQLQHAVDSQELVSSWQPGVQQQQQVGSQGAAGTPLLLSWQQSAVGHRLVRQVGPNGDLGPAALDGAQQDGAMGLGEGMHGSAGGSNDANGLPPGSADQQPGVGARRMVRLSKRQEQRQRALQDLLRLNVSKPSF